jgi:DNA-binding XRE family transcriptional regulator
MEEIADDPTTERDELAYEHAVTGSAEHQKEYQRIFWVNLDSLRIMAGMSQKDLAIRLGFLPGSFATCRKRQKVFLYEVCESIALLLECTVADLFSRRRYDYNRMLDKQGARHDAVPYAGTPGNDASVLEDAYRTIGAYDDLTKSLIQDVTELGRKDKQILSALLAWKMR